MYNHAPENYDSPLKCLIDRRKGEEILSNIEDIFYEDEEMTALISAITEPENIGSALIVPNSVYENLYDMPDDLLAKIHIFSKQVAIAMKKICQCDGVTIRQHNEPAGNQEVWHYHLHVAPRYQGDDYYCNYPERKTSDPVVRGEYAKQLRDYFSD